MTEVVYAVYESPLGIIAVVADKEALKAVFFKESAEKTMQELSREYPGAVEASSGLAVEGVRQLREFFAGERSEFDLPLDLSGASPFARKVLEALAQIPRANTVSYGELAKRVGAPHAARAVGRIMAGNRLPLVLPCHRVVGSSGKLTGYSGGCGIPSKLWLLEFEASLG